MFYQVVHIPESKPACREVGHEDCNQRAHNVCDKTEMEHFFQFQRNCNEVEVCRDITKLYRQTLDRETLEIQRVVMEKQYDGQKYAKHISVAVASESEHEIQQHNKSDNAMAIFYLGESSVKWGGLNIFTNT